MPFLEISRANAEIAVEINSAFESVMQNGNFILGAEVSEFEREWAEYCGTIGAVGVASGTDALTLALLATVEKGGEVITTTLSAGYTALAILNAGAIPVFADINPQTFNICPKSIESLINSKTRAIVPVHLYGQMAEMSAINELAEKNNLIVIEDAAQAHGAKLIGKPAGNFGHAAAYSFYPSKNLGALGDGGAVVSNDSEILRKIKILRQGGHFDNFQTEIEGRNSRLDEMQAAFLRVTLKKLDGWNARRKKNAKIYNEAFQNILETPVCENSDSHVYHLYVIKSAKRERLIKHLETQKVSTMIHYPFLLHEQKLFRQISQKSLPNAEKIGKEIVSLPLNPHLTDEEIEIVIEAVKSFC
ncbi:MAG TPA: DegT/DnrJ/EryC1/StrS family aminotransferase [Pyrinomonadaceae bacterium]|nr:DegT/DnrJ/EryC1/StrS family aminotransferase [Pyrinomonadaceae bacterium]